MVSLQHILDRAARRTLVQRILERAGAGLLAGLLAGLALLLADRLRWIAVPPASYPALAGLGLLAGVASAALTRTRRQALAIVIDHRFGLDDRLATASALDETPGVRQDPAFAALVRRQADALAARLDVAPAVPVVVPRVWAGALAALALLGAGVPLLPHLRAAEGSGRDARGRSVAALAEERAAVAESIQRAVTDLADEPGLDEGGRDVVSTLDALAEQLGGTAETATSAPDPDAAREASAAQLGELATRLAADADHERQAADELVRRFSRLETPEVPGPPPDLAGLAPQAGEKPAAADATADDLADALRRGDLTRAADLLDEIRRKADRLPEAERRRLAEELRDLAGRLAEAGATDPDAASGAAAGQREELARALRDQGLDDEAIEKLLAPPPPPPPSPAAPSQSQPPAAPGEAVPDEQPAGEDAATSAAPEPPEPAASPAPEPLSPERIRERLEAENIDKETARDLARDISSLREDERLDREVRRNAQDIADALDETAGSLEPEPSQPPPSDAAAEKGQAPPPPPPAPESAESAEKGQAPPPPAPPTQPAPPPDQAGAARPTHEPPQTPAARPPGAGAREGGKPTGQGEPAAGSQPVDEKNEKGHAPPSPAAGEKGQALPSPAAGEKGQAPPSPTADEKGQAPPPARPGRTPAPGESPTTTGPETGREAAPDAEPGAPSGASPAASPPRNGTPADLIRRIAERRRRGEDMRRTAERAREAAQRLADTMSEEERRRWVEQWQQAAGADGIGSGIERPGAAAPAGRYRPQRTDDLDLTGAPSEGDATLDWLDPDAPDDFWKDWASAGAAERARRIEHAKREAERAVDESAVPPRYHRYIRRFFGRLEDQTRPPADTTTPAAAPAEPAPASGGAAEGDRRPGPGRS